MSNAVLKTVILNLAEFYLQKAISETFTRFDGAMISFDGESVNFSGLKSLYEHCASEISKETVIKFFALVAKLNEGDTKKSSAVDIQ